MTPEQRRALAEGAAGLGVMLDARALDVLGRYLDLLLQWNRRINLTAVRDADEAIERHFVDSLAPLPHIPVAARTLVDAGSGAGFPGAVLAIARPSLSVTLVEAVRKKAAFLQTLKRELSLDNVAVRDCRLEDFSSPSVDVAISRATWSIPEWVARGTALVRRPGGLVIGMEGRERHRNLPAGSVRVPYAESPARALVLVST